MKPAGPILLVFTLGPGVESVRRALLPGELRDVEAEVWRSCLTLALDAGRACGCRLEVCSPTALDLPEDSSHVLQKGNGFGSRLEEALRGAFNRGAGPLLVVGTDIPGLAARHFDRTLRLLAEDHDRVVLGPSPDGGFYLLAASRPIEGLAQATRWRRRDTLRGLLRALNVAGRPVFLLEPLADLDRRSDLETWVAQGDELRKGLIRLLRRLLSALRRPLILDLSGHPRPALVPVRAGRAPPVSSARR